MEPAKKSLSQNRGPILQNFYSCNLRVLVISYSVCPLRDSLALYNVCEYGKEPTLGRLKRLSSEKYSGLLQPFVNYVCKEFYNIEPSLRFSVRGIDYTTLHVAAVS